MREISRSRKRAGCEEVRTPRSIAFVSCLLLAGCLPDYVPVGTDTDGPEYEDPDTTGPGPWEEMWGVGLACEECPEIAVECGCNYGSPQEWHTLGADCGYQGQYGVWRSDYWEDECAELGSYDKPLASWEFRCDRVPCGEQEPPTSYNCSTWNPDARVSFMGGVYGMERGFVGGLIYNPLPLVFCDDATLEPTEGGFEVQNADAGELLYELGLRDGDIPLDLNGFGLETASDVFEAISELWFVEFEDEYELQVLRGSSITTLYYSLYSTL